MSGRAAQKRVHAKRMTDSRPNDRITVQVKVTERSSTTVSSHVCRRNRRR